MMDTDQKLSIVHINTHDKAGGAAKVAWRLMEAQRAEGNDAKMLVGIKMSNSPYSHSFPIEIDRSIQAHCQQKGQLFYEYQGSHRLINNLLARTADILHMHNLHGGYFNPFSVSALSHLKPVIWSLHDMQSITGHCAHSFDCERWRIGCGECPYLKTEPAIRIDTSAQLIQDKKFIYENSYVWIACPSQWLKNKVERSILRNQPIELIHNGIDTKVFKPCDKKESRRKFGIPENVLVIGAVGHGGTIENQWKGGEYTRTALAAFMPKYPDCVFVNIGANSESHDPRILNIPHIDNESELAQAYSTLDIFLYTSIADNCPLVVLEALSGGIPIVTFDVGGIPELVRNGTDGCVSEYKNVREIVQSLEELATDAGLCSKYSHNARESAVSMFDHKIVFKHYEKLYERCLKERRTHSKEVKYFPLSKIPKIVITKSFLDAEDSKTMVRNQDSPSLDMLTREVELKMHNRDYPGAKLVLLNIIKQYPNDINALNNLAVIEIIEKNFIPARNLLERVLNIDSTNEIALENIACINRNRTSYSTAIANESSVKIDVSIVVATKNRAQLLDEMLTSLKTSAQGVIYEVIVVEGGSSDNTLEVLRKHGINQIYNELEYFGEGKHSWPQLYNFGFSKALGKWPMYASDDIIFNAGCFSKAVELLDKQNPEVAGGVFFYKNAIAEPGWDRFGIDFTYGQKLLMNYGLVRLDYFRKVNGFDKNYKFYCADGDLCLKFYEKGKQLIPLPGCFVVHNNVMDNQKKSNLNNSTQDIELYIQRWKHFVPTKMPEPRRLLWNESGPDNLNLKERNNVVSVRDIRTLLPDSNTLDQLRKAGVWNDGQPLRLHLGCGERYLNGYVNIDYPPAKHTVQKKTVADLFADVITLNLPDNSVDEIRLHHVFEHFDRPIAIALLCRWHLWLKIGGIVHIETPDFEASMTLMSSSQHSYTQKPSVMRHLFGSHEADWAIHKDGWYREKYEHVLSKLGFDEIHFEFSHWQMTYNIIVKAKN